MTEVRRCRACHEPAAISVRDWKGTTLFGMLPTGAVPRRDFVCQACGVGFAVEPHRLRLMAGILLAPQFTLLGALVFLAGLAVVLDAVVLGISLTALGAILTAAAMSYGVWAIRPFWVQYSRPVVDGAVPPDTRYRLAEPVRKCSCGQAVRCAEVTANRTNGLPTGTEYRYLCASCEREFVVESPLGQVLTVLASSLVLGIGGAILSGGGGAGEMGCAGAMLAIGVGGWGMALTRAAARFRFPVLPQSELRDPGQGSS
ncbi:MAG: hypothetical protein KC912_20495 [Proteobacteria bacterium]|nr:hypothetical protein [Pseudomonadota bacterium]